MHVNRTGGIASSDQYFDDDAGSNVKPSATASSTQTLRKSRSKLGLLFTRRSRSQLREQTNSSSPSPSSPLSPTAADGSFASSKTATAAAPPVPRISIDSNPLPSAYAFSSPTSSTDSNRPSRYADEAQPSPTLSSERPTDLLDDERSSSEGSSESDYEQTTTAATSPHLLDANLRNSLAMLDYQLASLECIGLPPRSSIGLASPTLGHNGDDEDEEEELENAADDNEEGGATLDMANLQPSSLAQFPLPEISLSPNDPVWKALGFNDPIAAHMPEAKTTQEPVAVAEHNRSTHLAKSFSISSAISSHSSSKSLSSEDEFDICDFPSFSDLATFVETGFAADPDNVPASTLIAPGNRSSNLLTFPIPPMEPLAPNTMDSVAEASNVSREAKAPLPVAVRPESIPDPVMERFSQLPIVETTEEGEQVRGLGLFDSRTESMMAAPAPAAVAAPLPAKMSFESSSGDDSFDADELRSDHSSAYTGSSHDVSTAASSALGNSFASSKEDVVATFHRAVTVSPVLATKTVLEGSPRLETASASNDTSFPFPSVEGMESVDRLASPLELNDDVSSITAESPVDRVLASHSKQTSVSTVTPTRSTGNVAALTVDTEMIAEEDTDKADEQDAQVPTPTQAKPSQPLPGKTITSDGAFVLAGAAATLERPRQMSFSLLRKRKSEANLSSPAKSSVDGPTPIIRLLRKSFSSPKLAKAAAAQALNVAPPPIPPSLSSRKPEAAIVAVEPVPPAPIEKDEPRTPVPPTPIKQTLPSSSSSRKLAEEPTKGLRKSSSRKRLTMYLPQVFGRKEDVPPVPTLVMPHSAPPTVTSFAQALDRSRYSEELDAPAADDTEEEELDEFATALSSPAATSPRFSDADKTLTRSPETIEATLSPLSTKSLSQELLSGFGKTISHSGSSTPSLTEYVAARETATPSPTPSALSERLTLAAFLESSPSSRPNIVRAPTRSSSIFASGNQIFPVFAPKSAASSEDRDPDSTPAVSRGATPLGDKTNLSRPESTERLSTVLDKGKGREIDPAMEGIVVPDIIAYPIELSSQRTDSTAPENESPRDIECDEDNPEQAEDDEAEDSDDQPLGTIPGALSTQKTLRAAARKQKAAKSGRAQGVSAAISPKLNASEFENIVEEDEGAPSRSASIKLSPPVQDVTTSAIAAETVGHSLLPQTDDAVERRANAMVRSPSAPLDPLVAYSSLVIDSPPTRMTPLGKPPVPTRGLSMPLPSTDAGSSRGRPALHIDTLNSQPTSVVAPKLSPGLAVPKPTTRSRSSSSPRRAATAPAPMIRQGSGNSVKTTSSSSSAAPPRLSSRLGDSDRKPATSSPLSRSVTAANATTTEHRVFIDDAKQHILVHASPLTVCGEIVEAARKQGVLVSGTDMEGGFALWEICRQLGLERPIREYELLSDVIKTWDHDSNILVIRRTTLWPLLSTHLRPQPQMPHGGFVQLELKGRKWSKRYLEVRDGTVSHSKSEKGKDSSIVCWLSSFEIFFVAPHTVEQRKAPKPFCFALKSKLPRAHFEDASDYCYFVSVKTADELAMWMKSITEARNVFERQNVNSPLASSRGTMAPRSPLIGHAPAPPLLAPRNPASHPAPPILAVSPPSLASSTKSNTPTSTGAAAISKPDARTWALMDVEARANWQKRNETARIMAAGRT